MKDGIAIIARKLNRLVLYGGPQQLLPQRLSGRTGLDHDEVYQMDVTQDEKRPQEATGTKEHQTFVPPKSPIESSRLIKCIFVGQQKRLFSVKTDEIGDVTCAAIGESLWPEEDTESDQRRQKEEQRRDNVEYFEHHKASPLSEIEIADTRKPITRATDGTAQNDEGTGLVLWRPEQLDTAEESLRRAAEIFRWNAMRGDPDSPHGRVLRKLRGEWW